MAQTHAISKEVFFKETELKKCRRSLLIHTVDKWVEADRETEGYGLADRAASHIGVYDLWICQTEGPDERERRQQAGGQEANSLRPQENDGGGPRGPTPGSLAQEVR
jgi:hypothetical protein